MDVLVLPADRHVERLRFAAELREDHPALRLSGRERGEILAVEVVPGRIAAGRPEKGRKEVHQRRRSFAPGSGGESRAPDQERNPGRGVVHPAFAEAVAVSEVFAVVGGENDQGVVKFAVRLQLRENAADLEIDEGDRRIVIGFDVAQQLAVDPLIAVLVTILNPVDPAEQRLRIRR